MTQSPPVRRFAVIGGGITGLAAAHRLTELAEQARCETAITLYEPSSRLGGLFGTLTRDGYTIETGADSFITSKPWGVDLCQRLGLSDRLIGTEDEFRRSLILLHGQPVSTPEGFELVVPRKLRTLLASPFLSQQGKLRVASEPFVPAKTNGDDESLASFVRRRFGPELLERIVQPMVGGIYTSDPEKLSMQATLPRFVAMERTHGSLLKAVWNERQEPSSAGSEGDPSGARYGLFVTLDGGMGTLIDALRKRLERRGVARQQKRVTSLRPAGGSGFVLGDEGGQREHFDGVLLAVPAYAAADLVTSWDPVLAQQLQHIDYASSAIVVTGHRLEDVDHPLDAFGLVVPHVENRRILAVSFLSRKFPDRAPQGHVQLRTFVGGAMNPDLLEHNDHELVDVVRQELAELLGVRGEPEVTVVTRYHRAMPQYHVGHLDRVARIEKTVARHHSLALAGSAYRGVGLPDCIHSGESRAETLYRLVTSGE